MDSFFVDSWWQQQKEIPVNNVIWGKVKDDQDFKATMKVVHDDSCIYLLLCINDFNRRRLYAKETSKMETMADYAMLTTSGGDTIYNMKAVYSKHAGGAFKNRYVDTSLKLKAGSYFMRYYSDESHYPGHWDAPPPTTPFYGMLVYLKE